MVATYQVLLTVLALSGNCVHADAVQRQLELEQCSGTTVTLDDAGEEILFCHQFNQPVQCSLYGTEPDRPAALTVTGLAEIDAPAIDPIGIVYVIDISSSVSDPASGSGQPACAGDENRDGFSDQIIDCEIKALRELHKSVASLTQEVGLIRFAATAQTIGPFASSTDVLTPPANISDINENAVFANLAANGWNSTPNQKDDIIDFIENSGADEGTNFNAAATAACDLLANMTVADKRVVFLSDGKASRGGNAFFNGGGVDGSLPAACAQYPFYTVAVGAQSHVRTA